MRSKNKYFFDYNYYNVEEPKKAIITKEISFFIKNANENQINFFYKILNAVKLEKEEVLIYNSESLKFSDLIIKNKKSRFVFLGFDNKEIKLNIDCGKYAIVQYDSDYLLFADNLKDIQGDVSLKKMLWGQLQRLFPN